MAANQFYTGLRNIKHSKKPVAGGLWKIFYAAVEDVAYIPPVTPATAIIDNPTGIVLKPGKWWYKFDANKRGYRTDHKEDDPGASVVTTVTPATPFDDQDNHLTLDSMKYHRYILVVVRPDRMMRIVGSLDNPARFVHSTDSGERQSDSASTSGKFTWTSEDLPPVYQGGISPVFGI